MTQSRGATAGSCTKACEGGGVSEPHSIAPITADTRDEMPHQSWRQVGGRSFSTGLDLQPLTGSRSPVLDKELPFEVLHTNIYP